MSSVAYSVVDFYERFAKEFDRDRTRSLMEKPYLEAVVSQLESHDEVLDLGCGSGEPIARYFIERGHAVTGVDTSPAMLAHCRDRFPHATWLEEDMRTIHLQRCFGAVIAWDSFFHLNVDDQRLMLARFAKWLRPGGMLLFTSGPEADEAIGELYGEPLYHASLSPHEYRSLLRKGGFEVLNFTAEDPNCGGHTVWISKRSN